MRLLLSTYLTAAAVLMSNISASTQTHYKLIRNVQFEDSTSDILVTCPQRSGEAIACALACEKHLGCTSVNFDPKLGSCRRNNGDIYTFGRSNMTSSENVHYLGKVHDDIKDGDWTLVFRGQVNNSKSIWTAYTSSDQDMANINSGFASKFPDVTLPHFRSRWLELWPSDIIDKVRLQLYKDGRTDVDMIFNGTGSNLTNWFSFSRLEAVSPYTDLTSELPWFSLRRASNQMFYISNTSDYTSCNQQAWIIVEDVLNTRCYWSSRYTWPRILYSASDRQVNFNDRSQGDNAVYRVADVLAVFLKFMR